MKFKIITSWSYWATIKFLFNELLSLERKTSYFISGLIFYKVNSAFEIKLDGFEF